MAKSKLINKIEPGDYLDGSRLNRQIARHLKKNLKKIYEKIF